MFERYTEKARRVVFFARYEASEFGSRMIDTDHLLLGLVREDKALFLRCLPKAQADVIRKAVEGWSERQPKIATSVDMPLSRASTCVLEHALNEADRLNSRHIGTEHLLLGLLQEASPASDLLRELGANVVELRTKFERHWDRESALGGKSAEPDLRSDIERRLGFEGPIQIHGLQRNRSFILENVKRCKLYNWHWNRAIWKPRDIVVHRTTGKISFDLALAEDQKQFELLKAGWKKDHCAICGWELFESDDNHGTGYTNGQLWVCLECYEKLWERPPFISGAYGELT